MRHGHGLVAHHRIHHIHVNVPVEKSDLCGRTVNFDADYSLTPKERAECMAFKRLLVEKFAPAVDFYFWVDAVNAKEFSLPWYGKHLERHSMEL